ncbi:nitroreductase family protein [Fusobacterium sp. PH5-44]|uniref:nitroreductase family protein n=1 Tax=unclassified Fusobacterium TaxID=2648384 RepID=UPI003D21EA97
MDFLQLVKKRYSVRKFDTRKIEKEKLNQILEAGRVAPTALNFQPQRILVLDKEDSLEKLRECTPYHFNAPMILIICYDKVTCWKNINNISSGQIDATIVGTHMMLEAANLEIGSTWVGHFDRELIRNKFNIPEYLEIVSILTLGYPADGSEPIPLHYKKFEIEHTVFYNSFDGIVEGKIHDAKY